MPKYRLEFEIHDLPKTINAIGRKHWAVKAKEAKKWRKAVCLATVSQKPLSPLAKAKISLYRYSSRCPDSDGLVSSFKHCIDGLISAGVIIGDSYKEIGMPEYKWEKAKNGEGKIKIIVESVPDNETSQDNCSRTQEKPSD